MPHDDPSAVASVPSPAAPGFDPDQVAPSAGGDLAFEVLGRPGRDNVLFLRANAGRHIHRFLFDCGDGCLQRLPVHDLLHIEALFFSHLHVDHIAGFDHFLRLNFDRPDGPVFLYGPPRSAAILQHRFRGVLWDRAQGNPAEFRVTEIHPDRTLSFSLLARESFRTLHPVDDSPRSPVIHRTPTLRVEATLVEHGTPCVAYLVRQADREHIRPDALAALGREPGPWVREVKDRTLPDDLTLSFATGTFTLGELRRRLLYPVPGESVGYLTDFHPSAASRADLVRLFQGCTTLVCENNYRDAEMELALRNWHVTSGEVGALARDIDPGQLILFHLSDRYTWDGWRELLAEVRRVFPRAYFPPAWARPAGHH